MADDSNDPSPESLGQQFAEMADDLRNTELGDVTQDQLAELQRLLADAERVLQRASEANPWPQGGESPVGENC